MGIFCRLRSHREAANLSLTFRLSVSSSVSNVAQPTWCWEMGFGYHLYVRGVVPSAKHYQHIATNSVKAQGISF